jgi:hypothetical protein
MILISYRCGPNASALVDACRTDTTGPSIMIESDTGAKRRRRRGSGTWVALQTHHAVLKIDHGAGQGLEGTALQSWRRHRTGIRRCWHWTMIRVRSRPNARSRRSLCDRRCSWLVAHHLCSACIHVAHHTSSWLVAHHLCSECIHVAHHP